jgi:PTH1 family peptidyl-tRNA hydrolase
VPPARIVVGLGNPGPEYAGTRHNVGFEVIEKLAGDGDLLFRRASDTDGSRLLGDCGGSFRGSRKFRYAEDERGLLVQPLTWMNLSGEAVGPIAAHLGAAPEDLLVVYDDLDLEPATPRIRPVGGHGGDSGMRSIIEVLGTDRFPRLRVGIGRSGTDAARHVLEPFEPRERVEMDVAVAEAAEAVDAWLGGEDLERVMTRFHSRWSQDPA